MKQALLRIVAGLAALALGSLGASAQSTPPQSSSGPAKLPYVAEHSPQFISVSEVNFMRPNDRLIGVVIGKVAKAYPAGIVSQHGLVEDQTPDGPIAITW